MTDIWGQPGEPGRARPVNLHTEHTRPSHQLRLPQQRQGTTEAGLPRTGALASPPDRDRSRPAVAALLLVGGALLGALVSGGAGPFFAVCSAAGAVGAMWFSSRSGAWWTVTAAPVVVLLVGMGVRMLLDADTSTGAALATGALTWSAHAFFAMLAALGAALAVPLVRRVRGRGKRRG
ncbi:MULTISPECIES: DUF6542 domain-containing protein [unclassified Streptomyces]|uniref:DUF6542 domain-containing protein n=1 Tax=unclassified Streptomyces TaxID=2593676 RepID=UPI0037F9BC1E